MSALDGSPLHSIIKASEELQAFVVSQLESRIAGTLPEDVLEGEKGMTLLKTIDKIMDLHALAFGSTRVSKHLTAEAKTAMDARQIGLQNVMYEKRHLLEEIVKCRDFRSVYQDVDLIPLDEFNAVAPPAYRQDNSNQHIEMINRLKFEHEARMRQEKLQVERVKLIKDNRKAQEKLDRFDKLYDDLVQASIPMELALLDEDKKVEKNDSVEVKTTNEDVEMEEAKGPEVPSCAEKAKIAEATMTMQSTVSSSSLPENNTLDEMDTA
ncbi:Fms-interacting protein-domain-containing protein [Phycomyces blakesleeanus]